VHLEDIEFRFTYSRLVTELESLKQDKEGSRAFARKFGYLVKEIQARAPRGEAFTGRH
jgi:hypothetical protein